MTPAQTFLLGDLAGFTTLTEAHGDEFAADVVEAFYRAVDQLLTEHAGRRSSRSATACLCECRGRGTRCGLQLGP